MLLTVFTYLTMTSMLTSVPDLFPCWHSTLTTGAVCPALWQVSVCDDGLCYVWRASHTDGWHEEHVYIPGVLYMEKTSTYLWVLLLTLPWTSGMLSGSCGLASLVCASSTARRRFTPTRASSSPIKTTKGFVLTWTSYTQWPSLRYSWWA